MFRALRFGGRAAWLLLLLVAALTAATSTLAARTAEARWARDVSRMVFNDNLELLRPGAPTWS
jgi:hypothetical protein